MGGGLVIRFDVVTLFPEMFAAVAGSGITSRALEAGLWALTTWNPRDFTTGRYRTVDDRPYGGGPGMVMLAEPLERALDAVAKSGGAKRTIYLSPQGRKLDHRGVMELAAEPAVTLLCGRYEGVDERLLARRVDEEISLGDFVLSGGEIAAMALMDAVEGSCREPSGILLLSWKNPSPTGCWTARSTRAPEVPGREGAGGAADRSPREHPALAAEAGAGADLAGEGRICCPVRTLSDEERVLLEEFRQESGAKP